MKIHVTAQVIHDDKLGSLRKGQVAEMIDHKAIFYIQRGEVEAYDVKVLRDNPLAVTGKRLSALPVAQALQMQTLSSSESGDKPKSKPKKGQ